MDMSVVRSGVFLIIQNFLIFLICFVRRIFLYRMTCSLLGRSIPQKIFVTISIYVHVSEVQFFEYLAWLDFFSPSEQDLGDEKK